MSPPPTSIDGTDITGATIDGQEVQEITIDGQLVFKAETNPVAYSDLHAWFPFDPSFYGGSAADDATALFNPAQSGNSTAFDGSVFGATHLTSGGVTDINAGTNSGHFSFDGVNDKIEIPTVSRLDTTLTGWVNPDSLGNRQIYITMLPALDVDVGIDPFATANNDEFGIRHFDGNNLVTIQTPITTDSFSFFAFIITSSGVQFYFAGPNDSLPVLIGSSGVVPRQNNNAGHGFGARVNDNSQFADGQLDDIRFYRRELSPSELENIYLNTEP